MQQRVRRRDFEPHPVIERAALGALVVVVLLALGACEKKGRNPDEAGLGLPDTTSTGTKAPKMGPWCEKATPVEAPADGTPEKVVLDLLSAAADQGDEEAAFERFHALYEDGKDAKWVRSQYWKRSRKEISKFLPPDTDLSAPLTGFVQCKKAASSGGRLKIFVKSYDMDKANAPVGLRKDDGGAWKVTSFTP